MNCPTSKKSATGGFALVVTLSLMVLLTVVAVGLLTLSTISLRTTSQGAAQAEARANARLALMLAIGDLQKSMGPDQRVSASGAIVSDSVVKHPHWTGVWNSWQAGSTDSTTDTRSEHSTIAGAANSGMSPTYEAKREDHFRSWLVSLSPEEAAKVSSPVSLSLDGLVSPPKGATAVQLVGSGSLGTGGSPDDYVSARIMNVRTRSSGSTPSSRYGWWIGDESQKARIMEDSYQSVAAASSAEKIFRAQAPGSTGTATVKGLENLTTDKQLKGLPSLKSLDLVTGVTGKPAENFHHVTPWSNGVLSDVREGGLKRDLSTLLERPVNSSETSDPFILYKFTTKDQWMSLTNQECVPIQDLAAYYQLYDGNRADWKEGTLYSSNVLGSGLQVVSPDYGFSASPDPVFTKQHSALYRQPVLVKLQFLMNMYAEPIAPAPTAANANTHVLLVGITPSITLWNPTNLPLVMRYDGANPNRYAQLLRTGTLPLNVEWNRNGVNIPPINLTWLAYGSMADSKAQLINLFFSGKQNIVFAPGEVKVFSLPFAGDVSATKKGGDGHIGSYNDSFLFKTDKFYEKQEVSPGWDPRSFMLFNSSAVKNTAYTADRKGASGKTYSCLAFKASDSIGVKISVNDQGLGTADGGYKAPFYFKLIQSSHQCYKQYGGTEQWGRNNYVFNSRNGGAAGFSESLLSKGFPGGKNTIAVAARSGSNLIKRSNTFEGWPFLQFSLQAGVETSLNSNTGAGAGRQFASRPFLHSSPLPSPFADDLSGSSLYNLGWNWSISDINEVTDAAVDVSSNKGGYYGGGYTSENGATRIVQQEIPVVPPINIAALSHARLGGYSIADTDNPNAQNNQVATVTGQAGLFPHTLQAIGNSYAHPLIPPAKAYVENYSVTYDSRSSGKNITFADHSYLANKALWDEFFFSSITPQPNSVQVFGRSNRSAKQLAQEFFFDNKLLPNRRMTPYSAGFDKTSFDALFTSAQQQQFSGGLADKIAARLMVAGPFNVNSTSVEAWKTFLSSLKGKPVAYLDKVRAASGVTTPDVATPVGTPVGGFTLANGKPAGGSKSPSDADQWTSPRELTDEEIAQLASAIVDQVKLRGPFLSLSEFVNRRLDSSNTDLSAKGALQAALDDDKVTINANFRTSIRQFSQAEQDSVAAAFPEAMKGPIAYGSAAYVDQADVLRSLAEQLTPRGDTFVIRTYGDSLDAQGNILARAWCEAVIQRAPEYIDPVDEAHLKQSDLKSTTNKNFGRRLKVFSFRWLNPSEV